MRPSLVLRVPTLEEEPEVMRAFHAARSQSPHFLHFYREGLSFEQYLQVVADHARGVNLVPGEAASTFLMAFVGERVVGRASIRHALSEWHAQYGGHIGYVVVPEFRRRGHATEILRQALALAHGPLGIRRVLVTCDDDNIGSIRTIEKNGGVFEGVVTGPGVDAPKRRYWFNLPSS